MKRLLLVLTILLTSTICFAADTEQVADTCATQEIFNEKSYAGFNLEKQPETQDGKQAITNKGSWFNFNIIINRKPVQACSHPIPDTEQ